MWKDSDTQYSLPFCDKHDEAAMAQSLGLSLAKFRKIFQEIQTPNDPIFLEKDGQIISERLREEKKKQDKYRREQAKKGKKSAEQRRNRGTNSGSTAVQPEYQPEVNRESTLHLQSSSLLIDRLIADGTLTHRQKIYRWFEERCKRSIMFPASKAEVLRDELDQLIDKIGTEKMLREAEDVMSRIFSQDNESPETPTWLNYFFPAWHKLLNKKVDKKDANTKGSTGDKYAGVYE